MSGKYQPGILIVDRTVHGPFENYRTPEQKVPTRALPYPWETNMTMTQSWGYNKHPTYKTTKQLIHTLIDVVAKGGNFLLNVGPTPDGTIETGAYKRLEEIGQWMNINGRGIYATRQWQRYEEGNHIRFTCSKNRETVYVFLLKWPGKEIRVISVRAKKNSKIFMLGNDTSLKWTQQGEELVIQIPKALQSPQNRPCQHAWTLFIEVKKLNK
jgi:alpha-L-fucosidase